jgi:hypothetical protein
MERLRIRILPEPDYDDDIPAIKRVSSYQNSSHCFFHVFACIYIVVVIFTINAS